MSDVVLVEVADRIGTVTLNRPEVRNALNADLRRDLPAAMERLDADDDVDVVIVTGADPAFCAGLDLKELASRPAAATKGGGRSPMVAPRPRGPFPPMTKPVIGAVNGVAITGGLEIALNCSFLIASDRARFADTHSRVGVMPSWGLTVLLPEAVGVRKAREMSTTGNFLDAAEALQFGLVNRVVPHEQLMPFTRQIALDIIGNDQRGVRRMLETYAATTRTSVEEGWEVERRMATEWQDIAFDPTEVGRRRADIMKRGRAQIR
ncbi:MAG TPA: enoyl-CoA hydratase [Acidimicrobiales bacterium]|nr:enoyl-CoA hydratase [Acidimicrobiales bacterium]